MSLDETVHDAHRLVVIRAGGVELEGDLAIPASPRGVVAFAHGSGSSRQSPRNRFVAQALRADAQVATLLFDLLSPEEGVYDAETARLRFDIRFLAERLVAATDWLLQQQDTRKLGIGYFGASTGAAAALFAAAMRPHVVQAIVSRGGRPDLAGEALSRVRAPTLLIVGGEDLPVIDMNRSAQRLLRVENALEIVPNASHVFEEPGAMGEVSRRASRWFRSFLGARTEGTADVST
jgi:pimeloyl-ACP methyl ester carboxylesterase